MTDIRLYNTLTRQKEVLRAPELGRPLTMYVCGPTVYGRAHIGNARPAVVFDVLYRLLRHVHGAENVRYARNITDIDDKIMAKAVAENRMPQAVAAEFEAAYFEDMAALGCLKPDFNPRATEHIAGEHGMIAMIEALVGRGYAYVAEGHVLFEVSKFDGYGRLSRRPMDEMIAGARVEVAPYKRSPGDFVLWKPSTPDQPGWESPWGRGRPGWHIECSAMIRTVLQTDTIDIHGGGLDLQFPHHENERAQSCCAHDGAELARVWMHNGFLTMGETKMSKSLGNIITPRELLEQGWDGEVIRLALLSAHYRQPLKWTDELLEQSHNRLARLYRTIAHHDSAEASSPLDEFVAALSDDVNTVGAMAWIDAEAAGLRASGWMRDLSRLADAARTLGFLGKSVQQFLQQGSSLDDEAVSAHIDARSEAKTARDWKEADRIRDELKAQGIVLEDHKDGTTTWRRA